MSTPCAVKINTEFPEVTQEQADQILLQIKNEAQLLAAQNGGNMPTALTQAEQRAVQKLKLEQAAKQRAKLFDIQAEQNLFSYALRFQSAGATVGEGILGFLDGSGYKIEGARNSIDAQFRNIDHTYIGTMWQQLVDADVSRQFRLNELSKEVYIESAQLVPGGKPGISGSPAAQKIAQIIDTIQREMTARMNRAGAWVADLPGYLVRQTHDMMKIRGAGMTKEESFKAWKEFVLPLLDPLRTFRGEDPVKWLRQAHTDFYTGIHGTLGDAGGVSDQPYSVAQKVSRERMIIFKGPEEAWQYNERFGNKELKQQVMTDITSKARAIALMENLGATPEQTLLNVIRQLQEYARELPDAAKQIDSINEAKIRAAYRQLTGVNDIPQNPTLARFSSNVRIVTQMIDMGRILLTNMFSDRAFMQIELASQGIPHMQILSKQLSSFIKRSPDQIKTLRMMGVGLDSIIGNALSRYSGAGDAFATKALDKAQKIFFDINGHNYWSDVTKSSAAEMMASWLGQHAELPWNQLPQQLRDEFKVYDIGLHEWNVIRATAYDHPSNWGKLITPEKLRDVSHDVYAKLLATKGTPVNHETILRMRDKLWTQLGTYISDRTEYAVPTGGSQVRRLLMQDTKAGTGIGEAMRLIGLFKSFPVAVASKILQRQIYGRGNMSAKQWLLNDHAGKFYLAQMVAMTTVAGYLGMTLRDLIDGKTPRRLIDETSSEINWDVINEAAIRGGGLGIMGEMLMAEYDKSYRTLLKSAAGPVFGKLDNIAEMKSLFTAGEPVAGKAGKFALDNAPLINLFYIRPILDYYVLWNLQEMMAPGSLERGEAFIEDKRHQEYYFKPSDRVKDQQN